jgi:glutathione S-transferase
MTDPTLVIGNKRYSSWSLRPWLAMAHAGIAFAEEVIPLFQADSKAKLLAHSPPGLVPVLHDGSLTVWDSLAICETMAERHPDKHLWPEDAAARARARAVSAEMHAGFAALRSEMPMNLGREPAPLRVSDGALADIARVQALWSDCRRQAEGGPFLFGAFSIADAMFAPVVARFRAYAIEIAEPGARDWADVVWDLPAMQAWRAHAAAEPWVSEAYER